MCIRDRCGVALRRPRARAPGPMELADPGVEVVPTPVVGRADLLVRTGMASYADPEDHAAPAQGLERGGLLGHGDGPAQGELDDARAEDRPRRRRRGDGEDDQGLEAGTVPEQVVTRPECAGAGALWACDHLFWHGPCLESLSYTHLRAHETVLDLVCRLLLEKKKQNKNKS